tara:strand:- start:78 stop:413 length:336 start_codon:yes stop_codon:yes gene_type:complete
MATTTRGGKGRTDVTAGENRSRPETGLSLGKYNRILRYSGSVVAGTTELELTGSLSAAKAFRIIDQGTGTTVLRATNGGEMEVSDLTHNSGSIYEIGVRYITGSSNIDLLY